MRRALRGSRADVEQPPEFWCDIEEIVRGLAVETPVVMRLGLGYSDSGSTPVAAFSRISAIIGPSAISAS